MKNSNHVRTICRSCGHGGCGVYVEVKDGKAVKIHPDKEHLQESTWLTGVTGSP